MFRYRMGFVMVSTVIAAVGFIDVLGGNLAFGPTR
jgi:hypothetical protein